ncbi:hypothetical protein HELRODRAFT_161883 [Helobdella robusta]|uniref:Uncharacterized protein n=1 Tax=Helobdella robusta TaxID=6412 RepID=T1ES00_HELRO|nr:hypothetical protein HELRODRAFT_161883 [Helobdella robusta]ESO02594.1 hypothetical protein HELRODRAFT_161883 [Helobdella robusta]
MIIIIIIIPKSLSVTQQPIKIRADKTIKIADLITSTPFPSPTTTSNIGHNITSHTGHNITAAATTTATNQPTMFIGAIILIVLMVLCAILGLIYSYIYFTRINPVRGRKFADSGGLGHIESGGGAEKLKKKNINNNINNHNINNHNINNHNINNHNINNNNINNINNYNINNYNINNHNINNNININNINNNIINIININFNNNNININDAMACHAAIDN